MTPERSNALKRFAIILSAVQELLKMSNEREEAQLEALVVKDSPEGVAMNLALANMDDAIVTLDHVINVLTEASLTPPT